MQTSSSNRFHRQQDEATLLPHQTDYTFYRKYAVLQLSLTLREVDMQNQYIQPQCDRQVLIKDL